MIATIVYTPWYDHVCHFQMSVSLTCSGLAFLQVRPFVYLSRFGHAAFMVCSVAAFLVTWVPETHLGRYWHTEPLIRMSFAPVLALAAVALYPCSTRPGRQVMGALLILAGAMVSIMMALNDIFWG